MAASNIRKKLITRLSDADEKKVQALYTLLEAEIKRIEAFKLSAEHLRFLRKEKPGIKEEKKLRVVGRKSMIGFVIGAPNYSLICNIAPGDEIGGL